MLKVKKPKITQVVPGVYLATFDNQFDLAMTFCRYQETYESPKYRNKVFSFMEFLKWYSKTYGKGKFSYPSDWNGFNVPSETLHFVKEHLQADYGEDINEYDKIMLDYIMPKINELQDNDSYYYYLIGIHTEPDSSESLRALVSHETAHGLYYTNKEYKKEIDKVINKVPKKLYDIMKKRLIEKGYTKQVVRDEFQAYMGTTFLSNLKKWERKKLKQYCKQFKTILQQYLHNAKIPK